MAATVVLVYHGYFNFTTKHEVINLKVSITSVHNKPSLYSNIFKRRLTQNSPLVQ